MAAWRFVVGAQLPATFALLQQLSPPELRGRLTGVALTLMAGVGNIAGAQLTGVLMDAFRAAGRNDPQTAALASVSLTCVPIGVGLLAIASYRYEKDAQRLVDDASGVSAAAHAATATGGALVDDALGGGLKSPKRELA
jgi:MFS family permease